MTLPLSDAQLRTASHPQCRLCGTDGVVIHVGLQDRLFHVPGTWNSRKCANPDCGLVWLDPMPTEADIHKAYVTYYTHQERVKNPGATIRRSIGERVLRFRKKLLSLFTGGRGEREAHYLMYLNGQSPGRLLEIGCGGGKRLARLAALGWQVEGQEVDEKACCAARDKYGYSIHLGKLEDLGLAAASYDAVVTNHVIEHVHHPAVLLEQAYRLLKPGGVLVAITPNADSQEHSIFGEHWFSLDPPRHLHLFTVRALRQLATRTGFAQCDVWTSDANSDYVAAASLKISAMGDMKAVESRAAKLERGIAGLHFRLWTKRALAYLPDRGEECVLRAYK